MQAAVGRWWGGGGEFGKDFVRVTEQGVGWKHYERVVGVMGMSMTRWGRAAGGALIIWLGEKARTARVDSSE